MTHRAPSALDNLAAQLTVSLMTLADVAATASPDGVGDQAAKAVVSSALAAQSATDAAAEVVKRDNGWFGFLAGPLEAALKVMLLSAVLKPSLLWQGNISVHSGLTMFSKRPDIRLSCRSWIPS